MKTNSFKTLIPYIGIGFIILALLMKRLSVRHLNMDSLLSVVAGLVVLLVAFLIFKVVLKHKK